MSIFKTHCHKTNIAIVALTSLYVIGTAVALSTPYWVSSTSILAPIAVFAATPLGISVLAFAAVALASLAIYSIIKNNEISELKAPRIVIGSSQRYPMLQVTDKDYRFIEENYKNKNGEYIIDFTNLKGEVFQAESNGQIKYNNNSDPILLGNTKLLAVCKLYKKNSHGSIQDINRGENLEMSVLGAEENDAKELIIRFAPSSIVKAPETEQGNNGINK
ncbi:hypothetical protein [Wolbachia endosymbiont (group B) of Camptogramma bilineatum]|uniref:hypothetical protein n=1 Tax=Wolbachia endosymbiont (group B) of Camptogramma bilineatum TaxID=2953991 RepID=UPI002230F116|nr:hypothetical protein [Wolbachia endosymbiont (group B) of Camptogramma bilineatum]